MPSDSQVSFPKLYKSPCMFTATVYVALAISQLPGKDLMRPCITGTNTKSTISCAKIEMLYANTDCRKWVLVVESIFKI